MVAISPEETVLVTGASGFIAAHLCQLLLAEGYRVRGTVRTNAKGDYLKNLFEGKGEFEYVIVEDIAKPGAFEQAVKGVQGIAHTASPFFLNAAKVDDLVKPAVQGTVGVLQSAQKYGDQVKRVVVTSSVAAIMQPGPGPYTLTEDFWNTESPQVLEKEGDAASGPHKYRGSKTLAERAAWEYVKESQPPWDLVVVNPPFAFGPIIHQVSKPEDINTSVATFYAFTHGGKTESDLGTSPGNWADVRDIAQGHLRALIVPEASNRRFILSAGPFTSQEIVDEIHTWKPEVPNVPIGKPGNGKAIASQAVTFSGERASAVLGVTFRSFGECLRDMHESLEKRFP
ncbi:putative D-lactaldehyde dehydrogenase [Naematelia encephala]|uniref:Putative D-lactaldehyde dehydrogenase n=1 Tax=Naematelia encephala TaxID=71784 RepID=A0A1Y2AX12_9TREE|nr:putative D-lactaldehyde dehydrogenase [Naematelia encephala]